MNNSSDASKLKRELKLLDVFCIATGAMISSGLFVLPALAYAQTGTSVVISYFLAGLLAMTGMFSQAELVSAMPKAGGTYFYVARSMGPALGTIDGLLTWLSMSLKSSFALVGMAAFTGMIINADSRIIALVFCVFFVGINILGIKEASKFQIAVVALLVGLLAVYIVAGTAAVRLENLRPFLIGGPGRIFATAGLVFISYGGLLKIASIAEEVKDPARTIPAGMIISLVVVSILYVLTVFVTVAVLSADKLIATSTPISDGAGVFLGKGGRIVMAFAAILAFVSTGNAGIMAAARYPLALARDSLLPRFLGRIHPRFKTPQPAILATGLFMALALFLDLYVLVEVASTVLIFTFIFSSLCVIVMRESGVQNYQPKFHAPFYPWMQVACILGCWLLVVGMGKETLIIATLLFTASLLVFWFYGRSRGKKDFALLHLIERVAAREFIDVSLEEELKEIIRERDNIVRDRFDKIVEESVVLDIEGSLPVKDFFGLAARELSERLGAESSRVLKLLLDREEESSTVLSPGLAIPHIIIEGEHVFTLLLARCKEGIIFPEADTKVHTVFVIAGTKDERNFHLTALSAIAQIVQDEHFEKKWLAAKDSEALRDLILLGKRKRQ